MDLFVSRFRYEHLSTKNNNALRSDGRSRCPKSHSSAQSSCSTDAIWHHSQRINQQEIKATSKHRVQVKACPFRG